MKNSREELTETLASSRPRPSIEREASARSPALVDRLGETRPGLGASAGSIDVDAGPVEGTRPRRPSAGSIDDLTGGSAEGTHPGVDASAGSFDVDASSAIDETRPGLGASASAVDIALSDALGETRANTPSPRPRPAAPLERGDTVGRYMIVGTLGAGGMGVVYAAYDPELDRKVALKLLRPELRDAGTRAGEQARTRLLREAQALARLAHPNVVAIYDVGAVGDGVWLAMEFIEGETLGAWVSAHRPTWRAVLEGMRSAGRGLEAAHAAGLVHRDFKPDNVMVGRDGRVRVMDLGLARAREGATAMIADDRRLLALDVTRAGTIVGTPAYMAPEQFRGDEADAAADVFSYCLTFWEALYGERPFVGETYAELEANVLQGRVRPPTRPAAAPRWLRRVLTRGLAADRAQRWPSMQALGEALAHGQARTRRWAGIAAGTALVAVIAGGLAARAAQRSAIVEGCVTAGASVDAIWSDEARARARAGLLASGLAYAPTIADKVAPWLDRRAAEWRESRTEACLDDQLRGLWDDDTRERGEWCFEERRAALESLVRALADANAGTAKRAIGAAAALDPAGPCRDRLHLARLEVPPAEARAQVHALRDRFIAIDDLDAEAKYEEGLDAARELLKAAEALGWSPLTARSRLVVSGLSRRRDDFIGAEAAAVDAYFEAVGAGAMGTAADAAIPLVTLVGNDLARHDDGALWSRHAAAAVAIVEPTEGPRTARNLHALGALLQAKGALTEAAAPLERALEIRVRIFGELHPEVAASVTELANLRADEGRKSEAVELHERALAIAEEVFGESHPDVAGRLFALAQVRADLGETERAVPLLERARSIYAATLGPRHSNVGKTWIVLARLRKNLGDSQGALDADLEALAVLEAVHGPNHPNVAIAVASVASDRNALGEYEEAKALNLRAVAIFEGALGPDHPDLAKALKNLAMVHKHLKEFDEARALLTRVLAIRERSLGPRHELVAVSLFNLARLDLERGDPAAARPLLERALDIAEHASPPAQTTIAQVAVSLAELALQQRRPADALAHADRALTALDAAGTVQPAERGYVVFKAEKVRWSADPRARAEAERRITEVRALVAATKGHADMVQEIDAWLAAPRSKR